MTRPQPVPFDIIAAATRAADANADCGPAADARIDALVQELRTMRARVAEVLGDAAAPADVREEAA